jgi:hypothetical protein
MAPKGYPAARKKLIHEKDKSRKSRVRLPLTYNREPWLIRYPRSNIADLIKKYVLLQMDR